MNNIWTKEAMKDPYNKPQISKYSHLTISKKVTSPPIINHILEKIKIKEILTSSRLEHLGKSDKRQLLKNKNISRQQKKQKKLNLLKKNKR